MARLVLKFLFDTFGGQALAVTAGLAALFAMWQLDRAAVRNEGARDAVTELKESGEELAAKMRAARNAVDGLNAIERLRERYCADCKS